MKNSKEWREGYKAALRVVGQIAANSESTDEDEDIHDNDRRRFLFSIIDEVARMQGFARKITDELHDIWSFNRATQQAGRIIQEAAVLLKPRSAA